MATADTRTWTDDATDALRQLEVAERELANWRAHLEAVLHAPTEGRALMAARSQGIVSDAVHEAARKTCRVRSYLYPRVLNISA
jgi:hypothetical protein